MGKISFDRIELSRQMTQNGRLELSLKWK